MTLGGEHNASKQRKRDGKHCQEGSDDGTAEHTDTDIYGRCAAGAGPYGTHGERAGKLYNRCVIEFSGRLNGGEVYGKPEI